jgi:benzoyl-CoA-dihydrodiol lyase
VSEKALEFRHVSVEIDRAKRLANLTVRAPEAKPAFAHDAALWSLRAFRELDDALLRLRFDFEEVGLVTVRTRGDAANVLAADEALVTAANGGDWFAKEVIAFMARTLRRLEATARSFFALVDEESCFSGSLLELALACDRTYMLEDPDGKVTVQAGPLSAGLLPTAQGTTRIALRFPDAPARATEALATAQADPADAPTADKLGLTTVTADDIDFADEVRVAIEERLSLSPDALTGLEQNLRFAGAENVETKIFGRLSAWQNWIFIRPNSTGERGALTMYGKPERPQFDARRT